MCSTTSVLQNAVVRVWYGIFEANFWSVKCDMGFSVLHCYPFHKKSYFFEFEMLLLLLFLTDSANSFLYSFSFLHKKSQRNKSSDRCYCFCCLILFMIALPPYHAAHCLSEKTGKESIIGVFDWPLTLIGQTSPPVKCPYGPPAASATRPCGGNFWTGGVWKNPETSSCKYKSKRTNQLNNLAKVGYVVRNVECVLINWYWGITVQ